MPRFFREYIDLEAPALTGDDARHIGRSLRMKCGENLTVCCNGIDHNCIITQITDDTVYLNLVESIPCSAEPNVEITLFQAAPKSEKLEMIVQKSVELGVSRVVPFISRRCISRPDEKDFRKKQLRLQKISEEAAKQSGRGIIPEISEIMTFRQMIAEIKSLDICTVLYEGGGKPFRNVDFNGKKRIGVVIGSEGGFDSEEVESLISEGAEAVWLGKRILRCETAPLAAMSVIMFLTGNL